MEPQMECGIGSCKPKWMRNLARTSTFAALFAVVGVVQGAIFTSFVGSITSIEKRYAFGSKVTGIINLADNISPVLFSVLIAYFASRGHRPRWCGLCISLSGLSTLLFAFPYFIYGSGQGFMEQINNSPSGNSTHQFQLCDSKSPSCEEEKSDGRHAQTIPVVIILFAANFLTGIGTTGYYVVGAPLADDTVSSKNSPLYFAVLYSFRLAGPTVGFLLSSAFLKWYEDPSVTPSYGHRDPRWVGAWWISFVVVGLALLFLGLLMVLFPKDLIGYNGKPVTLAHKDEPKKDKTVSKLKEMGKIVNVLIRNPILIFYNLAVTCQLLATVGYFVFLPKYLENEFNISPSKSNRISGIAGILVMVFGFMGSGIILFVFKPRPRYVMVWKVIAVTISAVGLLIVGFIGCNNAPVVTKTACESQCRCSLELYSPVCNNVTYETFFSPCHAGCSTAESASKRAPPTFRDCECSREMLGGNKPVLTSGVCDSECSNLIYFIIVLCLIKFFSSSGQIGTFLVMLRSVPPQDKTYALSFNSTFICAFAMIPYPLVYGAIVDSCCSIWETSCSGTGHCWVYDTKAFRKRLHFVTSGLFFASVMFLTFVCYFSKNVKNMYGEEDKPIDKDIIQDFVNEKGTNNPAFILEELPVKNGTAKKDSTKL